jgi:hypothetical protein
MNILAELTRISAAGKIWKPVVMEAYNDNRFFNMTPIASARWRPLIRGLIDSDKQIVTDLIGKSADPGILH